MTDHEEIIATMKAEMDDTDNDPDDVVMVDQSIQEPRYNWNNYTLNGEDKPQ